MKLKNCIIAGILVVGGITHLSFTSDTGFCIDEKRGIITGVDVNSDQPVVEWKITNV